jgi:uncharacterized membrane protein
MYIQLSGKTLSSFSINTTVKKSRYFNWLAASITTLGGVGSIIFINSLIGSVLIKSFAKYCFSSLFLQR